MNFDEMIREQKRGKRRGITSICSANPWVIRTALSNFESVVIEATCNQVNQFGGYSGMTPADFTVFVKKIARENNIPEEGVMLGGDHLGPNVWKSESASQAMQKSEILIRDYVRAGFLKIHVDCSMPLGDDKIIPLPPDLVAERTAHLIRVAEDSVEAGQPKPRYVIGTEVPVPGGAYQEEEDFHVTRVEDLKDTLEISQRAFHQAELESAWERILAVVVQPGVEFGNDYVIQYDRSLVKNLTKLIELQPFVFEAHSTDFQNRLALRNLVEDHFAILKVGPALTFSFREAVFSLAIIEEELIPKIHRSNLIKIIDDEMLRNPKHWQGYYSLDEENMNLARKYSLSDRIRYYWDSPVVKDALYRLFQNLSNKRVPVSLLHQHGIARDEDLEKYWTILKPQEIIKTRIESVLSDYLSACDPDANG